MIDKLKAHVEQDPPALDELRDDVPVELADIVTRMMAKDPADRFQRPDEVAVALAPFCRHDTEPAAVPVNRPPKRRTITAVCAAALIALLASVVFVVTDKGTFEIKSEFDDVEIVVSRGGEEFTVIDLATDSKVQRLPSGDYKISLKGRSDLELNKHGFTLRRWGTEAVTVTLKPVAPQAGADATSSDKSLELVRTVEGHTESVTAIDISADGRLAVSGGQGRDKNVRVWNLRTGEMLHAFDFATHANHLNISPDGRYVAVGGVSRSIRIWDLETHEKYRDLQGHEGYIAGISFSPDNRFLLATSTDGTMRYWDVEAGTVVHSFPLEVKIEETCKAVISGDGRFAVVCPGQEPSMVSIFDLQKGELARRFQLEGEPLNSRGSVAINEDASTLLIGHWNSSVTVCELATGKTKRVLPVQAVSHVAFLPDNRHAVCSGVAVSVWDTVTGRMVAISDREKYAARPVAVTPDGKTILSGHMWTSRQPPVNEQTRTEDFAIRVWQLPVSLWPKTTADRIAEASRLKGHSDSIEGLAWSADGKCVYSIGGGEKLLYQWDLSTGKVLRKVPVGGVPNGIAVLPDNQRVITSQYDRSITLWDMGTGRAVRQFLGHTEMVDDNICVTPDGKRLLSGGHDGLVRLWDIETATPIHSFHEKYCDCVAISSDGRLAAHGTSDSGWRLWEIESGQSRPRKERPSTNLLSLAFSPDGKYIVSGDGYGTIQVWDIATDTELFRFDAHRGAVKSLLFTRDGRHFLSGSVDRTLRMFDVEQGLEVGHVESNTMCVTNLALSPDGKTLATGGGVRMERVDGAIKFHKDGDYDIHLWQLPESLWPKAESLPQRATVAGSNPKKTNIGILTNPPSVPPGGLPVGKNLIVDTSLEETATGSLPQGWFAWLNDGPDFKCEVVEGGVEGKHCLQISGTGTRGVVFATSIPLDRTKRYALKGRVKVEGEAGTWAVVKLNYFNNTGWLGVDDRVGVTTSDLDWKLFEKTDLSDKYPTATLIVPTCHIEGNGTAWFDDLEVIAYDRDKLPDDFDARHGRNNRMK